MADVSASTSSIQAFIHPVVLTLSAVAGLISVGFLVSGGILMMSSSVSPDKLEAPTHVIRNALI